MVTPDTRCIYRTETVESQTFLDKLGRAAGAFSSRTQVPYCTSPKMYQKALGAGVPPICPPNRRNLTEKTCKHSPNFIPESSITILT